MQGRSAAHVEKLHSVRHWAPNGCSCEQTGHGLDTLMASSCIAVYAQAAQAVQMSLQLDYNSVYVGLISAT